MASKKKQMAEGFVYEDSIIIKFETDIKTPIGFIEKRKGYEFNTLSKVRKDVIAEIGDLVGAHGETFNFVMMGLPVSISQEDRITLRRCSTCETSGSVQTVQLKIKKSESNVTAAAMIRPSPRARSTAESPAPGYAPRSSFGEYSSTRATITSTSQKCVSLTGYEPISPRPRPNLAELQEACSSNLRPIQRTIETAQKKVALLEEELTLESAKPESLKSPPPPRPWVGSNKFTCSNCHNKGHKANKPCLLSPCKDYNLCGIIDSHDEHKKLKYEAEIKLKKLKKNLAEKKNELTSLKLMGERTKANFFSVMRPRLLSFDPVKYWMKVELQKDLLLLAAKFSHKVHDDVDMEKILSGQRRKSSSYNERAMKSDYLADNKTLTQGQRSDAGKKRKSDLTRYSPRFLEEYTSNQHSSVISYNYTSHCPSKKNVNVSIKVPKTQHRLTIGHKRDQEEERSARKSAKVDKGRCFRKGLIKDASFFNDSQDSAQLDCNEEVLAGGFFQYDDAPLWNTACQQSPKPDEHAGPLSISTPENKFSFSFSSVAGVASDNSWSASKRLPDSFGDESDSFFIKSRSNSSVSVSSSDDKQFSDTTSNAAEILLTRRDNGCNTN